MAHLRNCILCGKEYDYCPRCDETQPTYLLKYCGANCKEISLVLNKYTFKHLTKDEAADELAKLDLSRRDNFTEKFKTQIDEIMKAEKPVIKEEVTDPYEAIPVNPVKELVKESEDLVNEEVKTIPKNKKPIKKNK